MRRPPVSISLAASALVAVTLVAAASSAPKPRRAACGATPAGTAVVGSTPQAVTAKGSGLPANIDMHDVPQISAGAPSKGAPPEMPSHGIGKSKTPNGGGSTCVPQATPTLPAPSQR